MHGAVHRTSLTLALCACAVAPSDGLPDGCVAGDAPTLDVGAGASEYTALDDGDTVELVHGAQGGFHVVIALDGQFLDVAEGSRVPGQITATIDGVETALTSPYLDFRCNPDTGTVQSFGTLLIFTPTEAQLQGLTPPEFLDGKTAEIHAEVTDRDGRVVTADRTVVIHDALLEGAP
jgi:hypothetical protein